MKNLTTRMDGKKNELEVWQRGPVEGIPALLQPVAHALLQAGEDARYYLHNFPADRLWDKPAGVASVGFHLLHIRGVIDRLFTYARGEALSETQLHALALEKQNGMEAITIEELLAGLEEQVGAALGQLRVTAEASLSESRALGRKKIPTTVGGLLFHAAEHAQRHIGQLLVTSRIVQNVRSAE